VTETIFALSTPPGKSGVAIVRVSGPEALETARAFGITPLPSPRHATLAELKADGVSLDKCLMTYFPAPHSFTGEDVVEYHIHGSRAVIRTLLSALGSLPRLHPADPGEFTLRAFLNGKLDLTAAEGLADLIDAETEAQRKQALRFMQGDAEVFYAGLRRDVLEALALMEAYIDFPDEEIPSEVLQETHEKMRGLGARIEAQLSESGAAERVRDGVQVAILGAPNAGKSSLMNLLAKRDVAIVSETAGTTRDVIEVHLDIGGYAVVVADTAGLRETQDAVEKEGVRRSLARAEAADIKILVVDAQEADKIFLDPRFIEKLAPASRMQGTTEHRTGVYTQVHEDSSTVVTQQAAAGVEFGRVTILLLNKTDLTLPSPLPAVAGLTPIAFSAKTQSGMEELMAALGEHVARLSNAESSFITRARHRYHLKQALAHLQKYFAMTGAALELQCEELRRTTVEIGKITGTIAPDEVLGQIFSRFCIGK